MNRETKFLPLKRMANTSPRAWLIAGIVFQLLGLAAFAALLILLYVVL